MAQVHTIPIIETFISLYMLPKRSMTWLELFGSCIVGFSCSSCALKVHQWLDVDPSVQAVSPIEWVHVEKAGTSFLNTLMHIPGSCPGLPIYRGILHLYGYMALGKGYFQADP